MTWRFRSSTKAVSHGPSIVDLFRVGRGRGPGSTIPPSASHRMRMLCVGAPSRTLLLGVQDQDHGE